MTLVVLAPFYNPGHPLHTVAPERQTVVNDLLFVVY